MIKQEWLDKFGGKLLDLEKLSAYEKWALGFFHDRKILQYPYLEMTLQLDITQANANYRNNYANTKGASLNLFLMWAILKTVNKHAPFRYRKIDNDWYVFDNLPLFIPVAVGGDQRYNDVYFSDINHLN